MLLLLLLLLTSPTATVPMHRIQKTKQKALNCSHFPKRTKKAFNTYPLPDARLRFSVHLSPVCVTTETSDIPPKQMCKEEQ